MNDITTHAGFIAIVGAPNAGKSTFLNQVLGQKVSIVSPKVQTTRFNLRGILTEGDCQFIFVDTPGIHQPKRKLERAMVEAAQGAFIGNDVILLMVDAAKGFNTTVLEIVDSLREIKKTPILLCLNKVDQVKDKTKLLPLMTKAQEIGIFREVFAISALNGKGVDDVLAKIKPYLPVSPLLYDEDAITDAPTRLLAAEITRERAFMLLQQEIPYGLAVETVSFEMKDDGSAIIHQDLVLDRQAHKKIVIGDNASMVKKIGEQARHNIEELLDRKVHLFLKVKVREGWAEKDSMLRSLGLGE